MVPGGFLWFFMIPGGFLRFFMVPGWFSIVPGGFSLFFMVPGWIFHGARSVLMVFHGYWSFFHFSR